MKNLQDLAKAMDDGTKAIEAYYEVAIGLAMEFQNKGTMAFMTQQKPEMTLRGNIPAQEVFNLQELMKDEVIPLREKYLVRDTFESLNTYEYIEGARKMMERLENYFPERE